MAKVSVIIPAYNAVRTIERAVKCVLNQSLKDIELWVIDDGSTDGTGPFVDMLSQKDARLHVVHQTNAGAFAARLNGIKHATGEYFGFLDADDEIELNMYERMSSFATENDLDIVQCDIIGASTVGNEPELFLGRQNVLDKIVRPRLVKGIGGMLVWDKIYRNQYDVNGWAIEDYWTCEDYVLNWRFFKNVSRVGYLHEGYYHYIITPSSSTRKFSKRTIPGFEAAVRMRDALAREYGLDPNDADFCRWVTHAVRNLFIVAISAPATSFQERLYRAHDLLTSKMTVNALDKLSKDHSKLDGHSLFLKLCRIVPLWLIVATLGSAKRMQLFFRDGGK